MVVTLENTIKIYVVLDQSAALSLQKVDKYSSINHGYIDNFVLRRQHS